MIIEYKFLINPNKETLLNCYNAENTMFPYFQFKNLLMIVYQLLINSIYMLITALVSLIQLMK